MSSFVVLVIYYVFVIGALDDVVFAVIGVVGTAIIIKLCLDALWRETERMGGHVVMIARSGSVFGRNSVKGIIPSGVVFIDCVFGSLYVLGYPVAVDVLVSHVAVAVIGINKGFFKATEGVSSKRSAADVRDSPTFELDVLEIVWAVVIVFVDETIDNAFAVISVSPVVFGRIVVDIVPYLPFVEFYIGEVRIACMR